MFNYTISNSIIINDRVVSKFNQGIAITHISRLIKNNININHLTKKTYGSKIQDNIVLCNISEGKLKFSDL